MSDNSDDNEQPNQERPGEQQEDTITIPITEDPLLKLLREARRYIWDLPERLEDLDMYQRALLTSDNGALILDPPAPTYEPNTSQASRQQRIVESQHRNGTYVDASMPPLYTTSGVEVSLTRPNAEGLIDSHFRLAAFCL